MSKEYITPKQQAFIDCYAGDAKEASIKAGISHGYARQLLAYSYIQDAIRERQENEVRPKRIASRQERQAFWTACIDFDIRRLCDDQGEVKPIDQLDAHSARMIQSIKTTETISRTSKEVTIIKRSVEYKIPDRLKASELLGRSEADFTDNVSHNLNLAQTLASALDDPA